MTEPRPAKTPFWKRRWVTLGELVGIGALTIAGLGYWDNHRERSQERRAEAVAQKRAVARAAFLLRGRAAADGGVLRLEPVAGDQVIQSQTVMLPSEVRSGPVRTTGDSRIERGWLQDGVLAARRRTGDDRDAVGDRRAPVAVETVYLSDGETRTDRALYDVGYTVRHKLIGGDSIALEGVSLVRRVPAGDLRGAVDALWADRTAAETAAALARRKG